jgi:hypothetical protein
MDSVITSKWFWMMEYCEKHKLPPAQEWGWVKAENEYYKGNNMAIGISSSYSEGRFTSDKEDMIRDGRFWFKPDLHDKYVLAENLGISSVEILDGDTVRLWTKTHPSQQNNLDGHEHLLGYSEVHFFEPTRNGDEETFDKLTALEYLAFSVEDLFTDTKIREQFYFMFRQVITNDITSYTKKELDRMIEVAVWGLK